MNDTGCWSCHDHCWTCHHPASRHILNLDGQETDLPQVLQDAPCEQPGCNCRDYDGLDHPERPSLADAWIYRTEDGGVGVV